MVVSVELVVLMLVAVIEVVALLTFAVVMTYPCFEFHYLATILSGCYTVLSQTAFAFRIFID